MESTNCADLKSVTVTDLAVRRGPADIASARIIDCRRVAAGGFRG